MKLSTVINIKKTEFKLGLNSIITGIGSCFAEYVMLQFEQLGFNISYNPNGIVYNSNSILRSLENIVENKEYYDDDFLFHNNLWHSWMHHGSFSSPNKEQLISKINNSNINFRDTLEKSDLFILTPSSSVVYCLKKNNRIVANCHKYPGKFFYTKVISVEENYSNLSKSIELIKLTNPNCKIIITLSPVRHYPGDLVLNAKSKACLLSAIHKCLNDFTKLYYFPSYEILLDELRDYRFYADDMLHPSDLARKIIFQKFITTIFNSNSLDRMIIREKQNKQAKHCKLHPLT
jgi:hypothetical protein